VNQKTKFNLTSVEQAHFAIRHKAAYILRIYAQQMLNVIYHVPFHRLNKEAVLLRNWICADFCTGNLVPVALG